MKGIPTLRYHEFLKRALSIMICFGAKGTSTTCLAAQWILVPLILILGF